MADLMRTFGLSAIVLWGAAGSASAQAGFTTIDHLGYAVAGAAQDCTPDGATIVGVVGGRVYRWTEATGLEFLSDSNDQHIFRAQISSDGTTIVSNTFDPGSGAYGAGYWTEPTSWVPLGGLPWSTIVDGAISSGWGVSGDGAVVTGFAWVAGARAEAFRWTETTGMVSLGREPDASSRATNVSADGSVVVGWYAHPNGNWRPVRWAAPLFEPDLFLGDDVVGDVNDVASDGSRLVGEVNMGALEATAFFFDDVDGYTDIGTLSGSPFHSSTAISISENGVVVGWSGDVIGGVIEAFIWTPTDGIRRLADVLTGHGVNLGDWRLRTAKAVSADGSVIYGETYNVVTLEATVFRATLPPYVGIFDDGFESGDTARWSSVVP